MTEIKEVQRPDSSLLYYQWQTGSEISNVFIELPMDYLWVYMHTNTSYLG